MNSLWNCWNDHTPIKLKDTQFTLQGFSIAGFRTNFYIKELNLMLDAGISSNFTPKYILLTHTHSDHIANLPFHLYGKSGKNVDERTYLFMPKEAHKLIDNFINSMFKASFFDDTDELNLNLYHPKLVEPNNKIMLPCHKNIFLEIFKCDHSVPCVAYGLYEIRKKLKDEYKNLSGKEIGLLKKNGTQIDYEYEEHSFIFFGDTSIDMFYNEANKNIYNYKTFIVECSFLTDDEIKHADEKKHMHWIYLKKIVLAHPDIEFILIHFSPRYKKKFIEDFFVEENVQNVKPWISIMETEE